jgi:hypothetical protein
LIDGVNSNLIIYGQINAGKKYTLFGKDFFYTFNSIYKFDGIIPRLIKTSFERLFQLPESIEIFIKISSFEILKNEETISDLLQPEKKEEIKFNIKNNKLTIDNKHEEYVVGEEEIIDFLNKKIIPKRKKESNFCFEFEVTQTEGIIIKIKK